tara:strand:- start:980 stop:2122 length:1143 start_codon:yes stop_codon:yes gene_type:complete
MKKSIQITVPEPCHENWNVMTPSEKGRFCGSCQKEVIDFTQLTDEAIVKMIGSGKDICGRLKKSQLERELKLERKNQNPIASLAVSLLMPLSLLGANPQTNTQDKNKTFHSIGIGNFAEKNGVKVWGYVTDEIGKPAAFAEIIIAETGKSFRTDKKGFFEITCARESTLFAKLGPRESNKVIASKSHNQIHFQLSEKVTVPLIVGKIKPAETTVDKPTETIKKTLKNKAPFCVSDTEIEAQKQDSPPLNTIKGTVVDENRIPLPGVNVVIEGTSKGTQTDLEGFFEIETKKEQVLVISYMGYDTQELRCEDITSEINIQLTATLMGEVIIMGGISAYPDKADRKEKRALRKQERLKRKKTNYSLHNMMLHKKLYFYRNLT